MPKGSPGCKRSKRRINILERIERHTHEMREGECWVTTYKPRNQYGHVRIKPERGPDEVCDRPGIALHRVAWEAHNCEPIPDGMVIMHTCDNPRCFNPEHLRVGTLSDNSRDMVEKGRANTTRNPTTGRFQ